MILGDGALVRALRSFWMVVPALLAIAVVAGILGTRARLRSST